MKTRRKKQYRKPGLAVHGDIRALTGTKKSNKADSGSKPKTYASGTKT
ncbi:MAG: hypothetical protein ACHQU8_06545 [Gemmatimonadales bacterium]